MNAGDLADLLRRHYLPESRPPAGLFATEIGSPDGRRRADALWMPLVSSAGDELVGHEIKVARADVLVELQDPSKCEPWKQYCGRWWLVVADPALVDGLEIPESWGIMSPPSGRRTRSMTVVRPAPALKPLEPAVAITRVLAWSYFRDREQIHLLESRAQHAERLTESYRTQIENLRGEADAEISPQGRRAMELLQLVDDLGKGVGVWGQQVDLNRIARAVVDVELVERGTTTARHRLEHLVEQIAEPLGYARKQITEALRGVTTKEHT